MKHQVYSSSLARSNCFVCFAWDQRTLSLGLLGCALSYLAFALAKTNEQMVIISCVNNVANNIAWGALFTYTAVRLIPDLAKLTRRNIAQNCSWNLRVPALNVCCRRRYTRRSCVPWAAAWPT